MGIADTVLWNNTNSKGTTQKKHTQGDTHRDTPIHRDTLRKFRIETHTHILTHTE